MSDEDEDDVVEVPVTLTEIFDAIENPAKRSRSGRPSAKRDREELILRLQDNDTFVVRTILKANFDDSIMFPFPAGAPPFEPNHDRVPVTDAIIKMMGQIVKSYTRTTPPVKESILIQLLSKVNVQDAEIIVLAKDGKLEENYPSITRDVVAGAWPSLLPKA